MITRNSATSILISVFAWTTPIPSTAAAASMPIEVQKLLASDGAAFDGFGGSVSVDGDTAVIGLGSPVGTPDYLHGGAAYVFVRDGSTWREQAKLTVDGTMPFDYFGWTVAVSGDTAVIGAGGEDNGGSAYVFVRRGTTWTRQAKLSVNDSRAFGWSVSIDGDTAVIGDFADNDLAGSAYVFARSDTTWTRQAKLTASDAAARDWFGFSVSINEDTAVIGSFHDDDAGTSSGSAYVFGRDGNAWSEQAKLTASDATIRNNFGMSVSISGDTAVIGAFDSLDYSDSLAYVFVRSGTTWSEQASLTAISSGGSSDEVSISIDGDTVIIGSHSDSDDGSYSGSAYVFERSGSTWSGEAKLTASDAATGDQFGWAVSVSGGTAVIGSLGNSDAGNLAGSAYVFDLNNDTDDDGIPDDQDNCPSDYNFDQADLDDDEIGDVCDRDEDGDGVENQVDLCPATAVPESRRAETLRPNRYALTTERAGDTVLRFSGRSRRTFTTADTHGCSCEQIVAARGLGKGHIRFGCSRGVMLTWSRSRPSNLLGSAGDLSP